jgi:CBS-domain-containing membrane protein
MTRVTLRIRKRRLLTNAGQITSAESVFCPARGCSTDTAVCKKCVHAHAVSPEAVVCSPPGPALRDGLDAPAASAAMATVTVVRADCPAAAVAGLAPTPHRPVAVVDDQDRFLGFLSSVHDRPGWPAARLDSALAREVATGPALLLLETEPMAQALRLMATRGVRALALVDASGAVQGVLLDLDALRAIGRRRDNA